jgi:hypothetical protein
LHNGSTEKIQKPRCAPSLKRGAIFVRTNPLGKNYMMPLGPQAYPIKIFGWPFFMG